MINGHPTASLSRPDDVRDHRTRLIRPGQQAAPLSLVALKYEERMGSDKIQFTCLKDFQLITSICISSSTQPLLTILRMRGEVHALSGQARLYRLMDNALISIIE